jgi:hypothetical protein
MGFLWMAALVMVVFGFTVLGLARWSPRLSLIGSLRAKAIDPREWAVDVMSSGTMLSLGLWVLDGVPWSGQATGSRIALLCGGVWAVLSLARAVGPLIAGRDRRPSPFLPVAGEGSRPPWAFLIPGWVIAVWLAWSALGQSG